MNQEQMWAIWEAKDAAYDGVFFAAVRTTRVYCRPSCPARPLRKNIAFYDSADAAEAAGYRACKRCHPRATHAPAEQLAQQIAAFIAEHGHARLESLCTATGYSPFHLQRVFKKVMGVSPLQYARARRSEQLRLHLAQPVAVTTAIQDAGYSTSQAYAADEQPGMTPGDYKAGASGIEIDYMLTPSALGRMLIAATRRGLCAVYFDDNDAALVDALRAEYPKATLRACQRDDMALWAAQLAQFLAGQVEHAALQRLPVDVQGTAFQALVWQALREIPSGVTRSYSQIAQAIGRPTAMRAVANACGANRVAVVIPCHRVVREDGNAGGYRWGAQRKTQLLQRETAPNRADVSN